MALISYAQNFEDVILWRALKHVARGFYIDVGAQDPVVESVSMAFYENGWRGVHVEPIAAYGEKLRRTRSDEIVIQSAIGMSDEAIPFWEFPGTGLSTGDPEVASMHERNNLKGVPLEVSSIPLSKLLSDYSDREIHWLKIDVEGMEREVIQSWLPATARPWIVVVESVKPVTLEPSFADWEPLLVRLGYEFAYFDGLNRFYVSREQQQLKRHFGPGPNCFDAFALNGNHALTNTERVDLAKDAAGLAHEAAALRRQIAEREREIKHLAARAKLFQADLVARNEALAAIYASTSWRLTAPMRCVSHTTRWLLGIRGVTSLFK